MLDLVTGSFSYSGRFLTEILLSQGHQVRTLTNHPAPELFTGRVAVHPLRFDPATLQQALDGVDRVFNTYWVRFEHGGLDHGMAVENSKALISAAVKAGVKRFVHVSIANPDIRSPLPYYCGKAEVEQFLVASGLSYAIVRPTLIYGDGDILLNNIAWFVRHLPIFAVPGSGQYRVQPVFVRDYVALLEAVSREGQNCTTDAVGPDSYAFEELIQLVCRTLQRRVALVKLPPVAVLALLRVFEASLGDVVLTSDEIRGLMGNLLVSSQPPTCPTHFDGWLSRHGGDLGQRYASELGRHFHSAHSYGNRDLLRMVMCPRLRPN
jgi:uncharacterized protein YbjT (DUF2867 family)